MWKRLLVILLLAGPAWAVKLIPNGATSQSISVVFLDSAGDPNTSITVTNLDLYCQIDGPGAQATKIDCTALASADAAYSSGGAFHKGNGVYRVDIPDANLSNGVGTLLTYVVDDASTASTYDKVYYEVQLVHADFFAGAYITNISSILTDTGALDTEAEIAAIGSTLVDNIQAAMDANSAKLAFLIETLNLSDLVDNIQAAMDANSLLVNWTPGLAAILSEIHLSAIGDKVQADMDANSADLSAILADTAAQDTEAEVAAIGSTLVDNIVAAIDANSSYVAAPRLLSTTATAATHTTTQITVAAGWATDDAYEKGCIVVVTDADAASLPVARRLNRWTSGRVITLYTALPFTPANGDTVEIYAVQSIRKGRGNHTD